MTPGPSGVSLRAAALLLAAAAAAQAGQITGTVSDASGEPVEGAYIQASGGQPPEVLAQAQTDANGRYALDAPAGLLVLTVISRRHYVIAAGGLESESITKTCPEQGSCGELDFRLGKYAVVEGWITDRFGDGVAGIALTLRPEGGPATPRAGFGPVFVGPQVTDDRGYFRMWDLRPGRYVLEQDSRMRSFPNEMPSSDFPPQTIEINEPAETIDLRIAASSGDASHTIAGSIAGAPERASIEIMSQSEGGTMGIRSWHGLNEGRFSIPGIQTGDYVLRLSEFDPDRNLPTSRLLGQFHIDRDMLDLRLSPQPPTGVHFTVDFGGSEKTNLIVRLEPAGMGVSETIRLEGPDYESTADGMVPGEYKVSLFMADYYVASPQRITVQPGQVSQHTLQIGNEFVTLRGRVRVAEGAQRSGAAHFTVGIRGPHRRLKMQADDDGRFAFEKLPPGDYEVAAWAKPDVDVENDDAWTKAAGAVSKVQLEPGFDVEINLTATP